MSDAAPLGEHYFFIEGNEARRVEVPASEFWSQIMSGTFTIPQVGQIATADGWLVTEYEMAQDLDSCEMHPEGDELHYVARGELDLVLETDDGDADRVVRLRAGTSAVVPRGVWHRFVVHEPARALAVTFGRGTQHRPRRG
jgi:mannose-6-phosphate isomerase-like protein (cupin superfamily)